MPNCSVCARHADEMRFLHSQLSYSDETEWETRLIVQETGSLQRWSSIEPKGTERMSCSGQPPLRPIVLSVGLMILVWPQSC